METEESKEADLESQRQNPISNGPSSFKVTGPPPRPYHLTRFSRIQSFVVRLVRASWALVKSLASSLWQGALEWTFFQIVVRPLIGLLILTVGISVIQEIHNNNPVLDVVNVPEVFQKQGYTPDVVARRINDQIREKVIERQPLIRLSTDSSLPDLQIPTANISLKATILFVRQLLRFPPDRIMVDVMLDHPPADNESAGAKSNGPESRRTQLRVVVRRVPGSGSYSPAFEPFSSLNPEDVMQPIAQDVMDEAYQMVVDVDTKNAIPYNNWGNALAFQGKFDEAIAKYEKAVGLDPKYAAAYVGLGAALAAQGKRDEAIAKYQKAIELDPKYSAAYNNWGNALAAQGKFDKAIAKYQKAIDLDSKHAPAYNNNWGRALADQRRFDEAIAKYQKTIELDPKYARAYYNWRNALATEGRLDEAVAKYEKAVELEPQNKVFRSDLENALRAKRSHK